MPQRMIGQFEQAVLYAILALMPKAYGVPIHDRIEDATGRTISVGAIYTTLMRLEEKGLVRSSRGEPSPERGGRAKRLYQVTAKGQKALREVQEVRLALSAQSAWGVA